MDCSAPVAAHGPLTQGQALPGGGRAGHSTCCLLPYTELHTCFSAQQCGWPGVPEGLGSSQNTSKRQDLRMGHGCRRDHTRSRSCVVLHLLTVTTGCPTQDFLKLLALQYFGSLHLPLLGLCTHPPPLPVLAHSMQELLVGWCRVSRSQLHCVTKPSWCLEKELWMKILFSLYSLKVEKGEMCWYHQYWAGSIEGFELPGWGAQPRVEESRQPALAGLGAAERGHQLTAARLLKVSQHSLCVRRWKYHRKEEADLLLFSIVCGFLSLRSSILLDQKKFEWSLCVFLVFSSHISCFLRVVATAVVTLQLSSFCSKWKGQTCF